MPTYDYLCAACTKSFEVRLSIAEYSESKSPHCPQCGSAKVVRKFTPVNLATGSRAGGASGYCAPSAGPGCCS